VVTVFQLLANRSIVANSYSRPRARLWNRGYSYWRTLPKQWPGWRAA